MKDPRLVVLRQLTNIVNILIISSLMTSCLKQNNQSTVKRNPIANKGSTTKQSSNQSGNKKEPIIRELNTVIQPPKAPDLDSKDNNPFLPVDSNDDTANPTSTTTDNLNNTVDNQNSTALSVSLTNMNRTEITIINPPMKAIEKVSGASQSLMICSFQNISNASKCVKDMKPVKENYVMLESDHPTANESYWIYKPQNSEWSITYSDKDSINFSGQSIYHYFFDPSSNNLSSLFILEVEKTEKPVAMTYDSQNRPTLNYTPGSVGREVVSFMDEEGLSCSAAQTGNDTCVNSLGQPILSNFSPLSKSQPLPSGNNWTFDNKQNKWILLFGVEDSIAAAGHSFKHYFYNTLTKLLSDPIEFSVDK